MGTGSTNFSNSLIRLVVGNGTPLQYSCLENPMDGEAWWAAVCGVTTSRTQLSDFTFTLHFHALEKVMATNSSILAWRIPRMGEPGGLLSMGLHRVRQDWSDLEVYPITPTFKLWCGKQIFSFLFFLTIQTSGTYQFSSVAQLCLTLCEHMDCSRPGLPVHHQLPEITQTHWVGDAI